MAELDHEKIRVIAYELWERDGAPEGRDEDYWHAAVKLLSDEAAGSPPDDPASELPLSVIAPSPVK
ncbi:Protein of unknown function [Devosia sp. YR412]|uniref:DUF2934 domain-containing protein n=1 Tax=Devosia sp. YR412 TaxID=1881030 RepID=UPI0008CFEB9A|nr:DUF2934 domain-containing protein [Devosia sp. YR412]SEP79557.1 Protein of unknown function [Devosia sp. YR412]